MSAAPSDRRSRRALRKSVSRKAPRVTDTTLNTSSGQGEGGTLGLDASWYAGAPMTTPLETARDARGHFVKWLEWYKDAYPDDSGGSYEQLAPKLGVTPAAISKWRKRGSTTYPNMQNLIRLYLLVRRTAWVGLHIDDLLFRDPPPRPGQ